MEKENSIQNNTLMRIKKNQMTKNGWSILLKAHTLTLRSAFLSLAMSGNSRRRLAKLAARMKFLCLKAVPIAERSASSRWIGCKLQCVK
mmetsp:Transcript_21036/g.31005  ORF Transcript_21036/g.31005 Transcript_21036/m.31005 type:complete len:89 (-) Transcript_21036:1070-1336(-)